MRDVHVVALPAAHGSHRRERAQGISGNNSLDAQPDMQIMHCDEEACILPKTVPLYVSVSTAMCLLVLTKYMAVEYSLLYVVYSRTLSTTRCSVS